MTETNQRLPIPAHTCPECGYHTKTLDPAECPALSVWPYPGVHSGCWNCGALSEFQDDLSLRLLTEEEIASLPAAFLQHHARSETFRRECVGGIVGNLARKQKEREVASG